MATYVNDLRLKEIGTGESSGTWGTETNVNLELIGEALGYATEGITTNADTHATTVADGSTDPGRAMYIKYTGALDSDCTITIAPNTMSRVHFIENATTDSGSSGPYNIIISQGSGANVTIPNGFVKAVYLDGAGSGAAVTEAFTDLSVGGNLLIDGTTPKLTIGDGGAEDTAIVFDGNAQDFYIGLDDSADDLIIGLGSTVGTTPIISVDENKDVAIPDGSLTITTADNTTQLTLKSTDADASVGPQLDLTRDSASPAASDTLGRIRWLGEDDAGNSLGYAHISTYLVDPSDGSESAEFELDVRKAGTSRSRMKMTNTETVFNNEQIDLDFRVESNDRNYMLFVDAGNNRIGINDSEPQQLVDIYDSTLPVVRLTNGRNEGVGSDYDLGKIEFFSDDSSGTGARVLTEINAIADAGSTAPGGIFVIKTAVTNSAAVERVRFDAGNEVVFNDTQVDTNFRVESDGNANMIFVDAGSDHVNIGTSTDHGGVFNIETADNSVNLVLACTDTDTSSGPILDLTRDAGNVPSDGDVMGVIRFRNDNSDLVMHNYATIETRAVDVSAGTEDGRLEIQTIFGGDVVSRINLTHEETVFNDNSKELNHRVESDSNTHMLFVDGDDDLVHVGTSSRTHNSNTAQAFIVSGGSTGSTTPVAMIIDEDGSVEGSSCLLELSFTDDDAFSAARYIQFRDQGGTQGTISGTGDGTVDYNTSSDERLKEGIKDTESKWDALKAIKVRDYIWKRSGNADTGFIAQELNEHWPNAVSEGGEDVAQDPWSVDYGKLTPILTKALQEAMEKIENLEAEVAKLKGE